MCCEFRIMCFLHYFFVQWCWGELLWCLVNGRLSSEYTIVGELVLQAWMSDRFFGSMHFRPVAFSASICFNTDRSSILGSRPFSFAVGTTPFLLVGSTFLYPILRTGSAVFCLNCLLCHGRPLHRRVLSLLCDINPDSAFSTWLWVPARCTTPNWNSDNSNHLLTSFPVTSVKCSIHGSLFWFVLIVNCVSFRSLPWFKIPQTIPTHPF